MPSPVGTKGYTGNPNGRPRKHNSMSEILEQVLLEEVDFGGQKMTGKEAVARLVFSSACSGDMVALKYCFDRLDGTPRQSIDQSSIDTLEIHHIGIPDFAKPLSPMSHLGETGDRNLFLPQKESNDE